MESGIEGREEEGRKEGKKEEREGKRKESNVYYNLFVLGPVLGTS